MPEYRLELAARYLRRQFEKAVGRSIAKIVAELVTNSDDSYRRLAKIGRVRGNSLSPCPILVTYDRRRRVFQVTDHAEGLSDKDMQERFVTYGKDSPDRLLGMRTRSLFGKGLRDVLFTQKLGQVKSIKDGRFYTCRFRWKKDSGAEYPVVEIKPPARVTDDLREALQIPENGTVVEFVLAERVHSPQHERLAEKLSNFYMLRMINSSPHREVVLRTHHAGGKTLETQLSYLSPVGEVVAKVDATMIADGGQSIQIAGEIAVSAEPLPQGEVGYEERRGGISVVDEDDAVLDLTLFGFDEDPYARRIFGSLRLQGAGEYVRGKLNQEVPEEVLTETRDGFDKKHPFYRSLAAIMTSYLKPIVEQEAAAHSSGKAALSDQTRARHRKAFEILNKLYKDLLGSSARIPVIPGPKRVPPVDGIAFATEHISIQRGIETPVALLVNPALVGREDSIHLLVDTETIEVKPTIMTLGPIDDPNLVVVKILRLRGKQSETTGKLTASWKETAKEATVEVSEREVVTPIDGLEFELEEYGVRLGGRRTLKLYADVTKIPVGSNLRIACDSDYIEISGQSLVVRSQDMVTGTVAQVDVSVTGKKLGTDVLTASFSSFVASARMSVEHRDKKPEGQEGIFRDYEFRALDRKVQTLYDPRGIILINTMDPVNARYFGEHPEAAVESEVHCQLRLADLLLNECLQIMVTRALESGRLERQFPDNPEIDVWNYVNEKKFQIGPEIHTQFVRGI